MNIDVYQADLNGKQLRIAIVLARFNALVGEALLKSCMDELERLSVNEEDVIVVSVAGALEIPLALQKLAQLGGFHALIALGAVVRGDTYHFEVVSNEMASGITRVSLDEGIPIANGVLTVNTDEQAHARVLEKGVDCARVAVEMANLCKDVSIDDSIELEEARLSIIGENNPLSMFLKRIIKIK
jgi:6,7-dimethyl-8-ribityllumazine synthase